jgi:hypothetical protein
MKRMGFYFKCRKYMEPCVFSRIICPSWLTAVSQKSFKLNVAQGKQTLFPPFYFLLHAVEGLASLVRKAVDLKF